MALPSQKANISLLVNSGNFKRNWKRIKLSGCSEIYMRYSTEVSPLKNGSQVIREREILKYY